MPKVRTGPLTGLLAQVVLLAALAGTAGLGTAGWLAGLAYGVVVCAALSCGLDRAGSARLGPADRVTLGRAVLVGGVTALAADSLTRPAPVAFMVALGAVAVALDAVDGQVARRTGTVSALGARFDMEIDAFLILVLSAYLARSVGAWVLAMGAMRYAFVAAMWVLPWMNGTLPARFWRKVVAAAQGVVLVLASADALPRAVTLTVLAGALALLVESFARDVAWLWRHRVATPAYRVVRAEQRVVRPAHAVARTSHRHRAAGRFAAAGRRGTVRSRQVAFERRRVEPTGATLH